MKKKPPTVFMVNLHISATNDDLADMMRQMKAVRESGWSNVICTIDGYRDDRRELWQIPEVRAFCRRLFGTGFVSYLDVFAALSPHSDTDPLCRNGLGSFELWMMAEGYDLGQPQIQITRQMIDSIRAALLEANEKTDAMFGPFNTPTEPTP